MKFYYDMHIHSALSPCGDNDMTPNNIVNMSLLKGLDIIAVTDHNTCANVRAVQKAAEGRILVIPGFEAETAEEVHVVCYFPDMDSAESAERIIKSHLPKIENRSEIFGNQYYMNEKDEIIGEEKYLLVNATTLDIYSLFNVVKECGGATVPAHIDRTSYSVISNLGFIPPDLKTDTIEITKPNVEAWKKEYSGFNIITNSDAHYLEHISEREYYVNLFGKTTKDVLDFLCKRE